MRVSFGKLLCVIMVAGLLLSLPGLTSQVIAGTQLKSRDSIIRSTEDWPTYIDPAVGSSFSCSISIVNIYDSLVFPNPDGSVRPHLATSWDVSKDGLTYTFHLRKGVKFHNGDEVTAEDVEFSLQRLMTIGEGFAYLYTGVVDSVKALDKYTVQIKLSKPFGPFVLSLVRLYIVNKDQVLANIRKPGPYGELGDYGKQWLLTNDAGSGPYMAKEVKMEEYVLFEKFDDYWGGWEANAPDYFHLSGAVEPVTVRTAMARREQEITDELQPLENYRQMEKMEGVELSVRHNGHNLNIMLHTKKPPTDCIHFRKALAYCLDYDTVVTNIYPYSKQSRGPVPFNLPGHEPTVYQYTRNMDKAREELKKSKYYNDLKNYPVELSWCAEAPEEEKIALLFQANAAELGIHIEIRKTPFGMMIAEAQTPETTPNASVVFVAPHYAEAGSMLMTRYHSNSCGTWEQMEWLQDDNLDKMIEDALSTIDTEERFAKYAAIQKYIVDLCPTIWLFDQAEIRAYQANYIYWPAAELAKSEEPSIAVLGYAMYARDMKVFPEKRQVLLKSR